MRTGNVFRELAVCLITLLPAGPAFAELVSVTGGFTSFSSTAVFGTSAGAYSTLNGNPLCPDSGCSTFLGPATVNFGTPQSSLVFQNYTFPALNPLNEVRFTPYGDTMISGTGPTHPFVLGTLLFTNGLWSALDASFGFTLTTHSDSAAFDNFTITDTLFMQVTPNNFASGTPIENSDFVYFVGAPVLGSLRAFERRDSPTGTNTATALLYGYIDSLHLSGFSDASGGFLDPGIALAPTPMSVVEPGTISLFSLGLCVVLGFARRGPKRAAGSAAASIA